MPKMYMELESKIHQQRIHLNAMLDGQKNEAQLTQKQAALITQLEDLKGSLPASLDDVDTETWKVWDSLEDAFDKLMEFIGTINIDAIVTLATKAMDLALLIIDAVGGLYADQGLPVPPEFEDALKSMDDTVGATFAAAAKNTQLMFDNLYAVHKTNHQAEGAGCLPWGKMGSFFQDRQLDSKYKDMATWLASIANVTGKSGNSLAGNGELSGAFQLVFHASDYNNGHATASHATMEFNKTIRSMNDQLNIFEPSAYQQDKNDDGQGLTNMDDAIAFSQMHNIPVPAKCQAILQQLHGEEVGKVQVAANS